MFCCYKKGKSAMKKKNPKCTFLDINNVIKDEAMQLLRKDIQNKKISRIDNRYVPASIQ